MIFDNNFTSISLLGPLIRIEGAADVLTLPIIVIGNNFINIHSYLLTTVLHIVKRLTTRTYAASEYLQMSGGIHL